MQPIRLYGFFDRNEEFTDLQFPRIVLARDERCEHDSVYLEKDQCPEYMPALTAAVTSVESALEYMVRMRVYPLSACVTGYDSWSEVRQIALDFVDQPIYGFTFLYHPDALHLGVTVSDLQFYTAEWKFQEPIFINDTIHRRYGVRLSIIDMVTSSTYPLSTIWFDRVTLQPYTA